MKKYMYILFFIFISGCSTVKKVAVLPARVALIPVAVVDGIFGTKMAKTAYGSIKDWLF